MLFSVNIAHKKMQTALRFAKHTILLFFDTFKTLSNRNQFNFSTQKLMIPCYATILDSKYYKAVNARQADGEHERRGGN